MLIRCHRCQALFSVQDGVAAAGAQFQVECGRCASVFDASAPVRQQQRRADPVTPAPPAPGVREDLVAALRPRRPAQPRAAIWIAAGLVVLAFVALLLRLHSGGMPRTAQARLELGRETLLRDDARSIQQAAALFTEAARLAPGEARPEAERAFALLLEAGTYQALGDRLAQQRLQEGLAAARAALEDDAQDPVALRSLALHAVLAGAPADAAVAKAVQFAPQDPWVAYVKALAARDPRGLQEAGMLRGKVDAAALLMPSEAARGLLTNVLQQNPAHERAKRLLGR